MVRRIKNITSLKKIIYIKFGELTLKGKNKKDFVWCLYQNIKKALISFKKLDIQLRYDAIVIANVPSTKYANILDITKNIPGIAVVIEAYVIERNIDKLYDFLQSSLENKVQSFKIFVNRSDKSFYPNSVNFACQIGDFVLKHFKKMYVDVNKPQLKINIEIKHSCFVVYFNKIKARGGFPLGINGRILMLISGGIDSPVAAWLLMKKGFHVDFLTFISPPHTTNKAKDKVNKLISIITLKGKIEKPVLYTCKFTNIQHEIAHISNHRYQITIMRRFFFRIAQDLCKKFNYDAIATGESLGQVASQTIKSLMTIDNVLDNSIVLRPLLTYDKSEIISLAKEIGTYETSILPYPDACAMFVPTNPVTKPIIKEAINCEKQLLLIEKIYQRVFDNQITKETIDE